jgi:hypothetical protein
MAIAVEGGRTWRGGGRREEAETGILRGDI